MGERPAADEVHVIAHTRFGVSARLITLLAFPQSTHGNGPTRAIRTDFRFDSVCLQCAATIEAITNKLLIESHHQPQGVTPGCSDCALRQKPDANAFRLTNQQPAKGISRTPGFNSHRVENHS